MPDIDDDLMDDLLQQLEGDAYLMAYVGIHRAGGVAVPLNTKFTQIEKTEVIEHCGAKAIVCPDDAVTPSHLMRLNLTELRWVSHAGDATPTGIERSGEDLADILYTSGTTGTPKGVACTHDNIAFKGASTLVTCKTRYRRRGKTSCRTIRQKIRARIAILLVI